MNRRLFLQWSGATTLSCVFPAVHAMGKADGGFELTAKPGTANIVGPDFPATEVWGFNGDVPGTPIRISGVAGLTQPAIQPGESFRYQFTPPDSGTYWYHSHVNAYEQVGRGLYGPLIIDEKEPPVVDRDLVWMIDDWRLLDDASISNDFGAGHDRSHAAHR